MRNDKRGLVQRATLGDEVARAALADLRAAQERSQEALLLRVSNLERQMAVRPGRLGEPLPAVDLADVVAAPAAGRRIEAVRIYRRLAGACSAEASQTVSDLSGRDETCTGERVMYRRRHRAGNGPSSAGSGTRLTARSRSGRPAF